ncbi:hypothetical protein [Photobacterium atrarenae]|uniref:Uncharacterized protein n=1 Tax=Photobacterium atrarenae TaxID=865757 RepID=A0ABY5GDG0_9GAMM|nr:hypothetical protein [Photobacterium atrarenae]UTV26637.1 hypothetical protein NNL38_09700 [Photobacterium atrarenae]
MKLNKVTLSLLAVCIGYSGFAASENYVSSGSVYDGGTYTNHEVSGDDTASYDDTTDDTTDGYDTDDDTSDDMTGSYGYDNDTTDDTADDYDTGDDTSDDMAGGYDDDTTDDTTDGYDTGDDTSDDMTGSYGYDDDTTDDTTDGYDTGDDTSDDMAGGYDDDTTDDTADGYDTGDDTSDDMAGGYDDDTTDDTADGYDTGDDTSDDMAGGYDDDTTDDTADDYDTGDDTSDDMTGSYGHGDDATDDTAGGYGTGDDAEKQRLALNLVGTGEMYEMEVPDIDGDGQPDPAFCFDVDLKNIADGELVGTATDCLSNIEPGENGGLKLVGTTFFNLPNGQIVTRGKTTVQPVNEPTVTPDGEEITHITGASSDENSVIATSGEYGGHQGTVRLSGMVNLSEFNSGVGDPLYFDCMFILDLEAVDMSKKSHKKWYHHYRHQYDWRQYHGRWHHDY